MLTVATRRWRARCVAVATLGLAALVNAQPTLSEAQAKAGFVLNFARYVEWPASAFSTREAPMVVCLVGRSGLGQAMVALEGRMVQGRALKVRHNVASDDMRGCHVVFVGEVEERRVVPVLHALAGQPVLTVSDAEHFIDLGGAIGIVVGEDRLQFEVNHSALERAQLKASASLLKLARHIL